MQISWTLLIIFWVIVILFPSILVFLIGWFFIFLGINILTLGTLVWKSKTKDEYIKFWKYKIYR